MDLPRELRDHIIRYTLDDFHEDPENVPVDMSWEASLARDLSPWSECLPPICKVSYQLYFEATTIYLSMITPLLRDFQTTAWLTRSLAAFPADSGYSSIRRLAFRNFHGIGQTKGYELIALCPNLQKLSVMFGDEFDRPVWSPTPFQDAIEKPNGSIDAHQNLANTILMYEMHHILRVPRLKKFEFAYHSWDYIITSKSAEEMISWFSQQFLAVAMSVEIACAQLHLPSHDDYWYHVH